MKRLSGARFFFYALSAAGHAFLLAALVGGAVLFFAPPLERLKEGLPPYLSADGGVRPAILFCAVLLGGAVFIIVSPPAAFHAHHSAAAAGGRRALFLTGTSLFALSCLLLFLPPHAGTSPLNVVTTTLFIITAGAGAALAFAPYLSLGYAVPAPDGGRTSLSALQNAFSFVGIFLAVILLPGFFHLFPGLDPASSFRWSLLPFILAAALCASAAFFASREKRNEKKASPHPAPFLPAVGGALRAITSDRPFLRFLVADASAFFAVSLLAVCILPAFRDHLLADGDAARLAVILFFAAALAVLPFLRPLVLACGLEKTAAAGCAALAAGLLLFLLAAGLASHSHGPPLNCTTSVVQTPDGAVWIGTRRGAFRLGADGWTRITEREGLIDDDIRALAADEDGVWFATSRGASFFDGKSFAHFSKASGLIDDRVDAIMKQGRAVWFLTPAGISLLDNAHWRHFTLPGSFPARGPSGVTRTASMRERAPALTAFTLSPDGELWVGTAQGAYRLIGGREWVRYTAADGLRDDTITSIGLDTDGAVLLGTYRGVARWSGSAWSHLTRADGLPSETVRTVKSAPDGRLFIATDAGLFISDRLRTQVLTRADGLPADRVDDLFFASDGSIWFATAHGAAVCAGGRMTTYTDPLPRVWGIIAALVLAFPVAVILTLSPVAAARAAEGARGAQKNAFYFSVHLAVKASAALAAVILGAAVLSGAGESAADPLPVRLLLAAAAGSAGAGFFVHTRSAGVWSRRKERRQR